MQTLSSLVPRILPKFFVAVFSSAFSFSLYMLLVHVMFAVSCLVIFL